MLENHLFISSANKPLADRIRPRQMSEFVGQEHLMGEDGALCRLMNSGQLPSIIFYGPPGTGKTTAAHLICRSMQGEFETLSAVSGSVKEIREVASRAQIRQELSNKRTYLFIDEIHRFNKAQQDALLPYVESGAFVLIAATTENPSFYINHALLSRCRVFLFEPLVAGDLEKLLNFALVDKERGLGNIGVVLDEGVRDTLIRAAAGDARHLLVTLQIAADLLPKGQHTITNAELEKALGKQMYAYDKTGDAHYDVISAFIKSMRGSDPHAAVYYLARMLESGEDPRFVARRMVIFASEDIGNADPQAIQVAVSCMQAYEWTGMPEGWIPLAQAATYLASAPKSNASYNSYKLAKKDLKSQGAVKVPVHLRNGVTQLAKELGHGKTYKYPHDYEGNFVHQNYLPQRLQGRRYYFPSQNGYERFISERLEKLSMLDTHSSGDSSHG